MLRAGRARADAELGEAGDLLAVEAIDHTGLLVTSEGAFVRVLEVTPPNPLILSDEDREHTAQAFGRLVSRLGPAQSLQFYVQARPVNLAEILAGCRHEVQAFAGAPPAPDRPVSDGLALSRWRLYGAMERSLREHADEQAAMDRRAFVIVPHLPRARDARGALLATARDRGRGRGRLARSLLVRGLADHRRAVRESLAHTDAVRGGLDALGLPTRLLNGEQVLALLWGRFNPTRADAGRIPAAGGGEVLGELDARGDLAAARQAALRLRALIADSALDFKASDDHAVIERDLEQTLYAASTADATHMGWLMGAMLTRQPHCLTVHVHALDRRRERTRLKMDYRRTFALLRGAESRGRVPDFDRYQKESEQQRLLAEMAGHERASLFRVAIYQSLRARGPQPDPAALAEAVDFCREQIEASSDAKVGLGKWQQQQLWQSTLPLGRDVAGRGRKYATRNVGDTVPLLGSACGSPTGVPFCFSDPGRELQRWNPWDRAHPNGMMTVTGQSGSGKTNTLNLLLGRGLAFGARAFVLDRAGHFSTLVDLVDGARQIALGAEDSAWAINPWDAADPAAVSREKVAFLVSLHAVMMGEEGLSTLERAQLGAAIRAVYARALQLESLPRESLLRDELLSRSEEERTHGALELAALLRNLAERIGEFCGAGSYAYLLDRPTTVPDDAALIVFDTRRVPEVVLRPVMFATLEFVTRAVERHRDAAGEQAAAPDAPLGAGKSLVAMDEAWHMVGRRETGEYANDLARRSRHLGMAFLVATQQLSDLDTPYGRALLRNATQHLFLAQNASEADWAAATLNLTAQEAALVKRLRTVKGSHAQAFWINGDRGRGQIAIRLGALEQWAYTSDPVRDAPARAAAVAEHGGDVWAALRRLADDGPPGTRAAG